MALRPPIGDLVIVGHNDPTGRIRAGDVGIFLSPPVKAQDAPADYAAWGMYLAKWRIDRPMRITLEAIPNGPAVFIRIGSWQPQARPTRMDDPDVHLQIDVLVPSPTPDKNSDRWVRALLRWLVCHELDEWIKVDGERKFDPHANGKTPNPENS